MKLLTLEDSVFLEMQHSAFKLKVKQRKQGWFQKFVSVATQIVNMISKSVFIGIYIWQGGELTAAKITIFLSIGYKLLGWTKFYPNFMKSWE